MQALLTSLALPSLTLLSLTSAIPLTTPPPYLSTAHAFTLLVHVPNPAQDLLPSISHAILSPTHIGAGLNMLFLTPLSSLSNNSSPPNPQTPASMILNTTTSSIYTPLPEFPLGWVVPGSPGDHIVFLNIGTGTEGIGFTWSMTTGDETATAEDETVGEGNNEIIYPKLTGPGTEEGTYVACAHDVPFPPGKEVVAKFLFGGEVEEEGCIGIEFLPVCASASEGEGGAEVGCFVDFEGL